mgnify:CR=1 FL=1|jgi:L-cystine transport system ATP-binding protein
MNLLLALDPEMVGEVLSIIKKIADEGKTMVIVTHEVANRAVFMAGGAIIEQGPPQEILVHPKHERTKLF